MLPLNISSSSSSPTLHSPLTNKQHSPRGGKQWHHDNARFIFFMGAVFGFVASSFCSVAYLSMTSSSSSTKSRETETFSSMWMMEASSESSSHSSQQIRAKLKSSSTSGATTTVEKPDASTAKSSHSNIFDKSQPKQFNSNNNHHQVDDGWSMIHVFAGNASHIVDASAIPNDYFYEHDNNQQQQWFSQVRQDYIVANLLRGKRNGYFVDLAANDAIRISNTYALERYYNWSGICIEPNPIYWSSLSYRGSKNCHVVGAVVGERRMQEVVFKFNAAKGPQSGIVGPNFDNNNQNKARSLNNNKKEEQRRSTVTLLEVLQRFDAPHVIDYLSLDIEGAEYFVLHTFPFDTYRFNILTVERPSAQLQALLKENGYILLKELRKWGETLWIHKDVESDLDKSARDIDIPKYSEKTTTTRH
jgi:FkbM family methyltransferase